MRAEHRLTISLLKLFDLAIVVFAFLLSTAAMVESEHGISIVQFLSVRTRISNFLIFLVALIICHTVFQLSGLYRSRRLSKRYAETLDVLKAFTLITACFVTLSSVFSILMINIHFLAIFWVTGTLLLSFGRLMLRLAAERMRVRGRDLRYMLILGSNARAIEFARRITDSPERGYRLLGFVDDDWPGISALEKENYKVVSDHKGLAEYLRRNVVDEVAIYLPFGSFYAQSLQAVALCEQHGITLRFRSDIFGVRSLRWRSEDFDGDEHIATYTDSKEFWPRTIKRSLDVIVASAALIVLLPVFALTAIIIKLTSPGPVLFLQQRMGLNKRRFRIFKFRTMVHHAESLIADLEKHNEMGGPVFKIRNDPRITAVGRILRKTSIDELPQLLNVLNGDMSLVGPRPLPVRDYEGFNEDWQRRRFSVKPGITCLWQVNGRSGVTFDQWMHLDIKYMDEWSLWLDVKILAKTIPAVLKGSGAA